MGKSLLDAQTARAKVTEVSIIKENSFGSDGSYLSGLYADCSDCNIPINTLS